MMVTHDGFAIGSSIEVGVGLDSGNPQQDLFISQHTTLLLKIFPTSLNSYKLDGLDTSNRL